MAKLAVSKPQVLIDADIYDAQIVEVKEDHSDAYDKDQYAIQFQISDPDGEFDGQKIRYWATRYFDGEGAEAEEVLVEKSNLLKLVEAANPDLDLAEEGDFEIAELLRNRKVRINIVVKTKADGTKRSSVESILPASKKSKRAVAAAA